MTQNISGFTVNKKYKKKFVFCQKWILNKFTIKNFAKNAPDGGFPKIRSGRKPHFVFLLGGSFISRNLKEIHSIAFALIQIILNSQYAKIKKIIIWKKKISKQNFGNMNYLLFGNCLKSILNWFSNTDGGKRTDGRTHGPTDGQMNSISKSPAVRRWTTINRL